MARILVLTDRPRADERIVVRAVELAARLGAEEVAAVVTQSEDSVLPSGMLFGIPDGGLLPQEMSPSLMSVDRDGFAAAERFFDCCRQEAAFFGVDCETIRAKTSLPRTAAMLANAVGLVVVSRESLVCDAGELVPLRMLWSEVAAPLLVCPSDAAPWERIVVAARNDAQRDRLIAWGGHWSRQFDVPLGMIELNSPLLHSMWSAWTNWLPWSSRRRHREAVRDCLLGCGLGPNDLLLVDRESAEWPFREHACEASLDDLVASAPCSLGIVPMSSITATRELLYPHGLAHANDSILGFVAA